MLDLITVVFRDDVPLLKIQAKSIINNFSPDDVNTITIVVNDDASVVDLIDPSWWGKYQDCVKIQQRTFESRVNGWESQQLCKLLAAATADSAWSIVLDAKTWFVKKFNYNDIFDKLGKPGVGLSTVFEVFKSSQQFIESYYNISMPNVVGPQGVPFIFHTETAKELVNSEDDFVDFFQTNVRYPNLITEFHLYSGFVIKKYQNINALYNLDLKFNVINVDKCEVDKFDEALGHMYHPSILTASIHRKVYSQLSTKQLQNWKKFLTVKELLQTSEQFDFC